MAEKSYRMTVGDLLATLQEFDENLPVHFATGPVDEGMYILSLYPSEENDRVWVDLGDENAL